MLYEVLPSAEMYYGVRSSSTGFYFEPDDAAYWIPSRVIRRCIAQCEEGYMDWIMDIAGGIIVVEPCHNCELWRLHACVASVARRCIAKVTAKLIEAVCG